MSDHVRYAIYYLPPAGPLARFGAAWLGWDVDRGVAVAQPPVAGIEAFTATPRKYGFHGTLKPPFRLADGCDVGALHAAVARLAAGRPLVEIAALVPGALGHFLALVPRGEAEGLHALAAACVADLDGFRAPAGAAEMDKRRKAGLTERQEAMLQRWGYPYVFDEFRFHMTLTGRMEPDALARVQAEVEARLPDLPEPYVIDEIALAGERPDGMFETVHRYTLAG
ncbi:DUF1045 domain-containing protein [Psychromarinibacter sp. C21-152]|uniref:DUF1045 domain-containing protein n=1 Tax=Psychromarinibacter sediminicola TaxID=3033385 RepID=A0AAE3NS81_9RHOB|nr:DUF1045 domain-containing protein [Psychromarinibacter sediminicola]MDF0601122.1 DUF1045 domain-containing protein [Psychromarinibacter sediminicola]